jgi:hypothetical protein
MESLLNEALSKVTDLVASIKDEGFCNCDYVRVEANRQTTVLAKALFNRSIPAYIHRDSRVHINVYSPFMSQGIVRTKSCAILCEYLNKIPGVRAILVNVDD